MANNKRTVDSVISDAERLAQVWGENTKFSMGDLTLTGLNGDITKLRTLKQSREQARVDLSKLVDDTNDQMKLVEGYITRGRSAMKGSSERTRPNMLRWVAHVKASANPAHLRSPRLP